MTGTTSESARLRPLRFISDQPNWYGARSGYYAQLPRALAALADDIDTVTPRDGITARVLGKAWSLAWGLPARRQSLTADEIRFHARWLPRMSAIAVMLAMERHLPALRYWKRAPRRLIGTLHHPRAFWNRVDLSALTRLQSAVVLYRADLDFFSSFVGTDRVLFCRHGVDTDFFVPDDQSRRDLPPTMVSVGHFGRDYDQLQRVGLAVLDKIADARLVLVAAPHAEAAIRMPNLARHPRVELLSGLSDEELRVRYQQAALLLLPMAESGANNAVVEALACGLPIVTTDVGGIRDYGGGELFDVGPRGDDEALIHHTVELLRNESHRATVSAAVRDFAVTHLAWPLVAADHLRCYRQLAQ